MNIGKLFAISILAWMQVPALASPETLLFEAAQFGDVAMLDIFYSGGGNLGAVNEKGETALILAAKSRQLAFAGKFMEFFKQGQQYSVVNHVDSEQKTALHVAVANDDEPMARTLLAKGADPLTQAGDRSLVDDLVARRSVSWINLILAAFKRDTRFYYDYETEIPEFFYLYSEKQYYNKLPRIRKIAQRILADDDEDFIIATLGSVVPALFTTDFEPSFIKKYATGIKLGGFNADINEYTEFVGNLLFYAYANGKLKLFHFLLNQKGNGINRYVFFKSAESISPHGPLVHFYYRSLLSQACWNEEVNTMQLLIAKGAKLGKDQVLFSYDSFHPSESGRLHASAGYYFDCIEYSSKRFLQTQDQKYRTMYELASRAR